MRPLVLMFLVACDSTSATDAGAPECPTGAVDVDGSITCGTCRDAPCPDGYHCGCDGVCFWFWNFVGDGGVCPIDAGLDAAP